MPHFLVEQELHSPHWNNGTDCRSADRDRNLLSPIYCPVYCIHENGSVHSSLGLPTCSLVPRATTLRNQSAGSIRRPSIVKLAHVLIGFACHDALSFLWVLQAGSLCMRRQTWQRSKQRVQAQLPAHKGKSMADGRVASQEQKYQTDDSTFR